MFDGNNQEISDEELGAIKQVLKQKSFAVFQVMHKGMDYRSQITEDGKSFVQTNLFSQPGIPILSLEKQS